MADPYKSVVVGGGLKLKGVPPKAAASPAAKAKAASPPPVVKPKEVELKSATEGVDAYGRPLKKVVEKTPAEIAYEEKMRKRHEERLKKIASKSHKDKVAEFNKYLESLSEHHDIPRVGPG